MSDCINVLIDDKKMAEGSASSYWDDHMTAGHEDYGFCEGHVLHVGDVSIWFNEVDMEYGCPNVTITRRKPVDEYSGGTKPEWVDED